MAEIKLKNNMKTVVDNCGVITLIANTGKVCFIQVHPVDASALVAFLVAHGYSFT